MSEQTINFIDANEYFPPVINKYVLVEVEKFIKVRDDFKCRNHENKCGLILKALCHVPAYKIFEKDCRFKLKNLYNLATTIHYISITDQYIQKNFNGNSCGVHKAENIDIISFINTGIWQPRVGLGRLSYNNRISVSKDLKKYCVFTSLIWGQEDVKRWIFTGYDV